MKIAMVAPVPPPYGGIGNWVLLLDDYIKENPEITFSHVDTAPRARALDGRTLWDRVVVQGFAMFKHKRELVRLIKKEKVDVVHMTTSGQLALIRDNLMLKAARKKHVPTVYHIHFGRIPEIAEENTREWKILKKNLALATRVIAIDMKTFHTIKKHAPKANVEYIPNPFDTKKLPTTVTEQTRKEVVFVGWVIKTKGIEELLAAWKELTPTHPEWRLRIIGPYADDYFAKLKEQGIPEGVIFTGEQPHDSVMQLVSEGEIFTLPSYTEGFPNAVLEAMAIGKPIVATDVGAIPEMLDGCGIVIPSRDASPLKDALERLMSNEALRAELGEKAKAKLLDTYTIEKVFALYQKLWEEVTAK